MKKSRLGFARASSLRAGPILQLALIGAVAFGIGWAGHGRSGGDAGGAMLTEDFTPALEETVANVTNSAPAQALAYAGNQVAKAVAPVLAQKPEKVTRAAELDGGETFAELLSDAGATSNDAVSAMNALSKVYDLRKMKAGQDVTLFFTRTTQQEIFTGAVFQPEATQEIGVLRMADGTYSAETKTIPVTRQRFAAQAEIRSSLYEAGDKQGVPHAVMANLIRIFSHEVDFQRDIHPGDRFEILYEQPITAHGKTAGEGSIIYAALNVGGKTKPVYRVTFSDSSIDYFDEKGRSIRRALLRTPVGAAHITSGFGMRMHPVLGYSRMHKGVDFGAATGTPIFAAGNGVIEEVGFKGAYGRYIRVRHNGGLSTAYAHMSRFNTKMHRGARVNQGEVIGYVGTSGRSTGPHLHYEVLASGKQVNPMSINMPSGRTLDGKLLVDFKKGQGRIRQEFETMVAQNITPRGFIQASSVTSAFPDVKATSCGSNKGC